METKSIKDEDSNSSASLPSQKPDCDDETQKDDKEMTNSEEKKKGDSIVAEYKQSIKNHQRWLDIAKKVGDTDAEGDVYINLSAAFFKLGDYKQSIEYSELALLNAKELGNRDRERRACGNLGAGYSNLGDLNLAMDYHKIGLDIAKELGDRDGEASAYCNLGVGYERLGDFKEAVKYHLGSLGMAKKMGDRTSEGLACVNVGVAYRRLGKIKEAIQYYQLSLDIAKKEGDKEGEARAHCNIGLLHYHLRDFEQAIEYLKTFLSIAKELGDKKEEGRACYSLGMVYVGLGDFEQAKQYCQRALEISKEKEDMDGVGYANYGCGICSERLGNIDKALRLYKASIKQFNEMRSRLNSKDDWNITFRSTYQDVYNRFQNLLLMQNKIVEGLHTAEYGRAQALEDLLHSQYGFEAVQSDENEVGSSEMIVYTKSPVLYVSVLENLIQLWLLQEGEVALFTLEEIDADQLKTNDVGDLKSFIYKTVENISLPKREESPEDLGHSLSKLRTQNIKSRDLSILYDVTVGPIADLILGTDLIIVPDGPLFLAPFAAFVDLKSGRYLGESLRIRVFPSLTSLKMISLSPPDYHSRRGALIVGDPCLEKIVMRRGKPVFSQLKCAREEAKLIGSIVNVKPLIGKDATKEEVLKRLNTVALVHIAAHGDSKTGEIALAPNPSADSKVPKKDEYMLTMAEVLNGGLRARLVVLSCCNSGRGEIKAEGVVGISRAFLGAGARSVLVSLWAIEDEATLEFMRSFYQQLVDGKSASEALNQAMKCMRESQKFNAVKQWAPFVLIGDDVTLDFKGETDHAPNDSASGGTTSALESPISLDAQKKEGEIKGIRSQPPGKMTFCRGRMFWRLPGFIVGAAETQMTNQDEEDSIPIMDRMTNTINILKEGRYSDIGPVIGTVAKDILQPSNKTRDQQLLQKYCDHLCEIGAPAQLTMFLRRLIDIGMETEEGWKGMIIVRATLWNYSGASLKMASALGQSGALEMMLKDLDTYGPKQSKHEQKSFLVSSAVSILHNCAKASENRQIFCNLRAVERIAPLLKAEDMEVVMTAILTLSYITTDEQKDLLEADRKVISYFLGILRNSLNQPDLRESGWSALEIAVGLGNIAVNERNRETMIDREAISLLVSLLIKGGDTEKECAANALWVLVKDSRGKAKLKETPEAMEELSRLSNSGNHSVQEAVNRVLIALKEAAEGTRDDRVEECSREEQVLPD